jgi:hypothetical protein
MTAYTVVWIPRAEDQLAQIWLDATNRRAVNDAVIAIDALLSRDAPQRGDAEHEGFRRLRVPPLTVLFDAREADRVAEVVAVKRTG